MAGGSGGLRGGGDQMPEAEYKEVKKCRWVVGWAVIRRQKQNTRKRLCPSDVTTHLVDQTPRRIRSLCPSDVTTHLVDQTPQRIRREDSDGDNGGDDPIAGNFVFQE
ncbi:hypothetical protein BHM03_00015231, partial [Ensete ventricosum]